MITPYLFFRENCEEAINFYKSVFKGEITYLQRFGEANMPVEEDYKEKIMHATLEFEGGRLQFSDGAPHKEINQGDSVHLSLSYQNETKMRLTWGKLAEGGIIHMELQDTFWGAVFGQLEDKYGIRWMFNFQKEE